MVTFTQVKSGVAKYITDEIIAKMDGWKKWVSGAAVTMAMLKADTLFDALKHNEIVTMLGIIRSDGMIDIDTMRNAFKAQADTTGPITIEIPAIGNLTLSSEDIDMLYRYIKEGG